MRDSRISQLARSVLFGTGLLVIGSFSTGIANAEEPVGQFLEALRNRGYFDTAIEYIDQQKANAKLPENLKQSLEFERAMTLLEMSRQSRTSNAKAKTLLQSQEALETFTRTYPQHELAVKANSQLATILFDRARAAIWQSDSPPSGTTREQLKADARKLVDQTRQIYQKAHDLAAAKLKKLPRPAQQDGDKEVRAQYNAALISVVSNAMGLARCTYEGGQTFDRGSEERKERLLKASEEFREIHEKYRTWTVGPIARLRQGKCYEELDDIARALGIYNDVLSQGDDPLVRDAKVLALRFRLICLNHEKKKDYELVIGRAGEWLTNKANQPRSEDGLGIRWQKARAHNLLAQGSRSDSPDRTRQLRLALAEATTVSRVSSPYKDAAIRMLQRLKAELGDREGPPKDFDTAYGLARSGMDRVAAFKAAANSARKAADRQKAAEDLKLEIIQADENLTLALQLADADSNFKNVMDARYLLSYIKLEQRKSLDAIVLARYVMKYAAKAEPDTAMSAAEVAWVGSVQAYNAAGKDNAAEWELLEWITNETIKQWPNSKRANEARLSLGSVYRKAKRPEDAARLFDQIPKAAPQYGEAQLSAGQAWWAAAIDASGRGNLSSDDAEQIKTMTESAEAHLRVGLQAMANPAARPPESVTAARLSLGQIFNTRSAFADTIKMLTEGEYSVIKEITVDEGTARPESGIKAKNFASLTHRVLQRAYIGTQDIDNALAAMAEMEKIGGPDTQIYVQLGQELEREIERLKTQNDTARLTELRSSFEQFLAKVFERQDRQNYNSLIWVGETYRGLGQGLNDDPTAASKYFERAAASYKQILDKNLVEEPRKTIVQLRLVTCRRNVKDFDAAMTMLQTILKQHPKDVNAQFEAAYLLKDWGNNGQPEKLNQAIAGSEPDEIWGWLGLGKRLRSPNFREKYFESRFAMVESRRDYAMLGEAAKKNDRLKAAVRDINLIVVTQGAFEEPWWGKFDALYQRLQRDLGSSKPTALVKPEEFVSAPVVAKKPEPKKDIEKSAAVPDTPAVKEPESNGLLGLAIALPLALIAAGGMWFTMAKPRKRSASATRVNEPAPSFDGIDAAPVRKKKSSSGGSKRTTAGATTDTPAPRKKATPEQIAAKRARMAKAKAQAATDGTPTAPQQGAKKKISVKRNTATGNEPVDGSAKKIRVRKTPRKPPEAS